MRRSLVNRQEVWYQVRGTGIPLLFLPGWGGPTDKYDAIIDDLAARGYFVVLPDLPGLPGKTSPEFVPLKAWAPWIAELTHPFEGHPFALVSHSLSARIALEYLAADLPCLCAVFIEPWLISSSFNATLTRFLARMLRFLSPLVYPDMKWVFDRRAWKTAMSLFSSVEGHADKPCLVLFGKSDPAIRLFSGWKRLGCDIVISAWGHSPQVTATSDLAATIDQFVKRNA